MDYQVLYRKYRPQSFGEIAGQTHVVKTLQNALAQNKVAHAYLFAGPRGSGKTTIARILSKALNCVGRGQSAEPCNQCTNCDDFNAGRSLDLIEIDAASNRGIDEMKNLREHVRFGPSQGKYKVYLIDEAHMLTKEACNAFLKTLEEPPAHAIFILATTEAHRLPITVVSRTQRFDFKRLSVEELVKRLELICQKEKIAVEAAALRLIAQEADGAARDAESMLGLVLALGESKISLAQAEETLGLFSHGAIKSWVEFILSSNGEAALDWLHKAVEAGYDLGQLLKSSHHYLRKLLLLKTAPVLKERLETELGREAVESLSAQAQLASTSQLSAWLKKLAEIKQNLDYYPLPQMAVEVAIVELMEKDELGIRNNELGTGQKELGGRNDESGIRHDGSEQQRETQGQHNSSFIIHDSSETTPIAEDAFGLIKSKWNDIAAEVKPYNHSLSGLLQSIELREIAQGSLVVSTKYDFHRDRLRDVKNKKAVEDALEKITGQKLKLECVVEK
ncbi:MAG: DNA polymerase III subunit gamma/tau [Patescibacteria group bacterium]